MNKSIFLFALPILFFGCSKSSNNNNTITPNVLTVTTVAGSAVAGYNDGTLSAALFSQPQDIAIDQSGILYVADQANNVIRKITTAGVTTLAGTGQPGYLDNAKGTLAQFNGPSGIVLDDAGNVYVADTKNNVIREITPSGAVSTYAGNGLPGFVNSTDLNAQFSAPTGLAIDKAKNIYVTDYGNNVVRKIASSGTVTTFAGNGTAGSGNGSAANAEFSHPAGITIDANNNLYVAEPANNDVRLITPSGVVSTFAANLSAPLRVSVDVSGYVYASCGNEIFKINASGLATVYAGGVSPGFTNGPALQAQFNAPSGIAIDSEGNLYIADSGNNSIRAVAN